MIFLHIRTYRLPQGIEICFRKSAPMILHILNLMPNPPFQKRKSFMHEHEKRKISGNVEAILLSSGGEGLTF